MSYLTLAKKSGGEVKTTVAPRQSLTQLFRTLNVAVLLEIYGQDVWVLPHEGAKEVACNSSGVRMLPDEVEFLHKMEPDAIKAVFLIKSSAKDANIVGYKKLH